MFKRALIAAAVTAAVAAPVAFADVTISGYAEMDLIARTNNATTGGNGDTARYGVESDLMVSFDGKDKWDNGLSTIWRVSQKPGGGIYSLGQQKWGGREAFIGVAGDSWSVKGGRVFMDQYLRHDWPYLTDGSGNVGEDYGISGQAFWDNAIQGSITFGPATLVASYALPSGYSSGNHSQSYEVGGGVDFGTGGHFDLSYLAIRGDDGVKTTDPVTGVITYPGQSANPDGTDSVLFTGIRYPFGPLTLSFDYTRQNFETSQTTGNVHTDLYHGLIKYQFNDRLGLHVGDTEIKDSNDNKANQFNVALHYQLSKQTETYARIRYLKLNDEGKVPAGLTWQNLGMASSKDNATEFLIGTWTGF
ncbi:porin [Silvimonas amylolytica]|uniref:Porin domain-containing protein n=1 Tax=Silvimonas amylolytica TaxID=449663 RepID=A0ABQ2PHU3_9NEIS|nr:porin [Silvimonas amylolytica]GGP25183.1 hypothetical protein GCM10010971_10020 [Silvimonas amylolytica]